MSHTQSGRCQCGSVKLELNLPHPLKCYAPRACICDFCTCRNISWLSDPKGKLAIRADSHIDRLKQGSEQAEFITCHHCHDVVAVCLAIDGGYVGAVNSQALDESTSCKAAQVVSPQKLAAEEKVKRWSLIWMPVTF